MEAMIMNHGSARITLFLALYFLVGLLCTVSFVGCTDTKIVPASEIAGGKVTLSWNNIPGAISYNIYFSRTAGVTPWNGFKIPSASNPITVIDLDAGKTYYFAITVVGNSGESGVLSEKAYTVTNKDGFINFGELKQESQKMEGKVTKEQVAEGQVTLSWDNVANASSYNIYYSDSPGVTKQNGTKIANVTNPYTIKGLKQGKVYYFVVTTVTNSGESKESEELYFSVK
jgi:fibronectin type 3 domain-containing protein